MSLLLIAVESGASTEQIALIGFAGAVVTALGGILAARYSRAHHSQQNSSDDHHSMVTLAEKLGENSARIDDHDRRLASLEDTREHNANQHNQQHRRRPT